MTLPSSKAFSPKTQADLDADSQNVNLGGSTPYFYMLAMKLSMNPLFRIGNSTNDTNPQIMALKALSGRLPRIAQSLWKPHLERNYLERSAPFAPSTGDAFINKLDYIERKCIIDSSIHSYLIFILILLFTINF